LPVAEARRPNDIAQAALWLAGGAAEWGDDGDELEYGEPDA
jgi:hypothetical protein